MVRLGDEQEASPPFKPSKTEIFLYIVMMLALIACLTS